MNSTEETNTEMVQLRQQLEEANDLIEAIKTGAVDALAINDSDGLKIYTLKSADLSYRLLVERMNEGAVILDAQGIMLFSNATFANFVGVSLERLIGKHFNIFVEDNYQDHFTELFKKGWNSNSKGEVIIKHSSGKLTAFSVSINSMELEGLPVLGIIVTDLSSKNEIEFVRSQVAEKNKIIQEKNVALEKEKQGNEEAQRLRYILEGLSHMTWTNLANGDINFYNQKWYDYTGTNFKDTQKWGWKKVVHPDDLDHTLKVYSAAVKTGSPIEIENRYKRASDGSYRWHINRAMPIRNEIGDVILWVGTATDIHEQKQSEEKFRFLAETVPQIFWTATPEGNLDYYNQRWYDYTGLSLEESKDWGWLLVIHPEDLQHSIERWKYSIESGADFQIESRYKSSGDGPYRWHLVRAEALKDKDDKIVKWFGTSTDIHEQKEAIENLYAAQEQLNKFNVSLNYKNEQLVKINNDLDNFIYTASHDLKAPVSNIEGLILTLQDVVKDEANNPDIHLIIKLIFDSIARFKSTILDLTEITKIQRGEGEDIEVQNICQVIEDVKSNISEIIKKEGAVIETGLECPLISYSKKNLYSIMYNLISNGVKYRSFDKNPHIVITSKEIPGYIVMSVTDNGLGMDLSQETKIFSMFKRLHDHVEGSGVGLYLVKRIVDNAGGKIEVESEVGKGSTFRVYFRV